MAKHLSKPTKKFTKKEEKKSSNTAENAKSKKGVKNPFAGARSSVKRGRKK